MKSFNLDVYFKNSWPVINSKINEILFLVSKTWNNFIVWWEFSLLNMVISFIIYFCPLYWDLLNSLFDILRSLFKKSIELISGSEKSQKLHFRASLASIGFNCHRCDFKIVLQKRDFIMRKLLNFSNLEILSLVDWFEIDRLSRSWIELSIQLGNEVSEIQNEIEFESIFFCNRFIDFKRRLIWNRSFHQ